VIVGSAAPPGAKLALFATYSQFAGSTSLTSTEFAVAAADVFVITTRHGNGSPTWALALSGNAAPPVVFVTASCGRSTVSVTVSASTSVYSR
jgi:hypothetical protein